MQVMTFWKNELDRSNVNLTYAATNSRRGCNILRFYLDRKDQHLSPAVAAHNGLNGSGRCPTNSATHSRHGGAPNRLTGERQSSGVNSSA